jgi:PhnB protein
MKINPYLGFNGQCEAAFRFYERCFGGKILALVTYAETPMAQQMPAEWQKKIVHARLAVGDDLLMGGDAPPEHYEAAKGMSVTIGVDDPTEAERLFHALAEKGTVRMPIQKTFWAQRFGTLTDQFGTPWMINCEAAG